ncbi:universal stress, partial [Haematococcus lacustris]
MLPQMQVLVAVDESPHSRAMLDFALRFQAIHRATDQLHLVTVLPPPSVVPFPSAPLATSAAITTVQFSLDAQRKADQEKAATMLRLVADLLCTDYRVPKDNLHPHVLPATGGASGVSESLLGFAKAYHIDLLVLGSRGMGMVRSALMSLLGMGSVSDALLRAAPCPLLLVK